MGGKAGRKRRHFLRPQAPEEEEARTQLSELHKNEWQDSHGRLMGGVGVMGERTQLPSA